MTDNIMASNDIKEHLDRILSYLENDERTGRKGLFTEMTDIKSEVTQLRQALTGFIAEYRQSEAIKKAKMAVYGAIGGTIIWIAGWLGKLAVVFIEKFIH